MGKLLEPSATRIHLIYQHLIQNYKGQSAVCNLLHMPSTTEYEYDVGFCQKHLSLSTYAGELTCGS